MKTKAEIVQNLLETYAISPEEAVILLTPTPHIEKETFLWQEPLYNPLQPWEPIHKPYCSEPYWSILPQTVSYSS